jgi:hypothetical protein
MAVVTARTYATVTLPGAAGTTNILRAAVGQDTADNQNLPLEVFISSESTGIAIVDEGA